LTIIKKVDLTNVSVGDLVNFTITVINNGPSNATMVRITDELIKEFGFINATGNYTRTGQKLVWTIDRLSNGTNASVWVQVKVLIDGNFTNVASVNCSENTTEITSDDVNVTVNPVVNLTLIKAALNATVNVNDLVNFTITVINNGPSNATMVRITDELIKEFSFINATGNYTRTGQKVIWTIDRLSNGTNATVWIQVRVITDGKFTNVAAVNCSENTTEITSNGTNVTVNPVVDLSVNKTVSKTNVKIGDSVVYTITVRNDGPSNAAGVVITEGLNGTVEITGIDPSKGRYNQTTSEWTIEKLNAGESAILNLTVKLLKSEVVRNFVSVKANEKDTNYSNDNYTCDNVTVNRLDTPIDLKTVNITYGEDETITVILPQNATGALNITVGSVTYPDLQINNGKVVLPVYDLDGGMYNVTVEYGGDGSYKANSTNGTFKVSPRVPVIKIEVVDIFCGEIEVLNVTIDAPGTVNVTILNKTVTISLDHGVVTSGLLSAGSFTPYDGFATWNVEDLKVGTYKATAVYGGNENYASVNTSAVFNVKPLPSKVEVSADDICVGEDAIIRVLVGPANATGNVTVKVDGKTYVRQVKNGVAEVRVSGLKAGVKKVDVSYSGDGTYLPSENSTTFKVKKVKPPIDVDSHDIMVGDDEKIGVTLPEDATGTVTITVDGKKYTAQVRKGVAEFTVPGLKAGKYDVAAEYSGDDKYLPAEGSDPFRVSKVKPHIDVDAPDITLGDDGVITVEMPSDATGTVTIEVDGRKYTATLKNGKAVFRVSGLKVGKHDIEVSYSGDDKYLPATAQGDIEVHPAGGFEHHEAKGLERHATGNPIMVLLVVIVSLCSVSIRKLKK
jgi:uncharacterized repeat protein (TIGR01451 family)